MAWDLSLASYDSVSVSVSGQTTTVLDLNFSTDGTKMYVASSSTVYQYTLSTPWDLSTASYASKSKNVSAQTAFLEGVAFKADGSKMYALGTGSVYQYSLSTPWDVSTASYDSVSFSVSGQDTATLSITFKPDGSKMYVGGTSNNKVYQYSLSTPWNLSTASYDSKSLTTSTQTTSPQSIAFKPDGTRVYVQASDASQRVYQYDLTTAWDISTAGYNSVVFTTNSQDTSGLGLAFRSDDGTKMYVAGDTNNSVYQYSMPPDGGWRVGAIQF